jgi:large subunit ribosomal protein L1
MDRGEILKLIGEARSKLEKRGFRQSFELYVVLDDNKVKKDDIQINEIVALPHRFSEIPRIAVIAGGDAAVKAKEAGASSVISPDDVDRLSTNKNDVRKLVKSYDFFVSEASLMSRVGRTLGRYLGPRGKMPVPVPGSAQMGAALDRIRSSVRVRARGQFSVSAKIGDEDMDDGAIADNAMAIIEAVKNKLPQGEKAIKRIIVKATMGEPAETSVVSG